jgi:hypothetical protein
MGAKMEAKSYAKQEDRCDTVADLIHPGVGRRTKPP